MRCGFVLLGLALVVVGLWLARRARRAGRRGSAPHCFQCGYNLTGLPLPDPRQRCPECGAQLSALRTVARGRPSVHRPMLTVGILLMIAGGLITVRPAVRLYRSSWTAVKPTSWLLEDARVGGGLTAVWARYALFGRMERGRLSTEDAHAFVEHLLELQARPRLTRQELTAVEWLGVLASQGRLSPGQMQRFLDNILVVNLEARRLVPAGTPIPLRLWTEQRSWLHFGVDAEVLSLTCDGQDVVPNLRRAFPIARSSGLCDRTLQLPCKPLGEHELHAVIRARVYPLDSQNKRYLEETIHEITREARAKCAVVAKQPEDLIKLQPDPTLTDLLCSRFALQSAYASYSGAGSAEIALLMRAQERMPVNVAFEVRGEFEGQSLFLGYLTCRAGERPRLQELRSRTLTAVPDLLRIRLVASIDAALSNPALNEIWDGDLDLGPIPVENAARVRQWLQEARTGE
jgi:hypothetical protein